MEVYFIIFVQVWVSVEKLRIYYFKFSLNFDDLIIYKCKSTPKLRILLVCCYYVQTREGFFLLCVSYVRVSYGNLSLAKIDFNTTLKSDPCKKKVLAKFKKEKVDALWILHMSKFTD